MQKGFKKAIPDLVKANPGLTAREYAEMALNQHICGSDSKDPVQSLATTMMKEVREGRMPSVKSVKGVGAMRYYPTNNTQKSPVPNFDKPITILIPTDVAEVIDSLLEINKFENKSKTLVWLAQEGIKAKSSELAQVKKVVEQIKQLKQSVPV